MVNTNILQIYTNSSIPNFNVYGNLGTNDYTRLSYK